jgi:hypothetical protein
MNTQKANSSLFLRKVLVLFVSFGMVFTNLGFGGVSRAIAQDTPPETQVIEFAGDENVFYYYADGQRIPLEPSLEWVSVKFVSEDWNAQSAGLNNSGAPFGPLENARRYPNPDLVLLPVQNLTLQELIDEINALRGMTTNFVAVDPVFKTADAEMVITDQFIATFSPEKTMEDIRKINQFYGVEIVEAILGQNNTFILTSNFDTLSMANLYQEQGIAISAAPNFVRITKVMPEENSFGRYYEPFAPTNDDFYTDQWYLNNIQQYGSGMVFDADIDAPEAWDYATGSSSVIIAIIDEGVDLVHEDLMTKLIPGYDATGGGSAGGPQGNDAHGTAAAGIAAAIGNNTIGVAGICRSCQIMPIRVAYGYNNSWITSDSWLANGIAFAYQNGAHVLNNSWGGGLPSTVITNAINNAQASGRGGKGSVVVFAAGNDNSSTVSYPASLSSVIAVGASNMCDQRKTNTNDFCNGYESWWGSNYGTALDISAPGVWIRTTDIMGAAGYASGNYEEFFNGTSAAAPIVSGVAGLILSVNPDLTAAQVQAILQNTADDVNGGGWDIYMGYGRVNAYSAVQAALPIAAKTITNKTNSLIQGVYSLSPNQEIREAYASLNNGPVEILSSSGNVLSSMRVVYAGGSYSEMMGFPDSQVTNEYIFPYYNNVAMNSQLRVSNLGATSTTITVYLGGIQIDSYTLAAGAATRKNYAGQNSGPLRVESSATNILSTIRVVYLNNSYSELMGYPVSQLTNSYLFPYYNNVAMNSQLRVSNLGVTSTTIKVYLGNTQIDSYTLGAGAATRKNYVGQNSGPLRVESSATDIISTIRVIFSDNSYSELMGFPANQLAQEYWYPVYDNVTLNSQLRVSNVGNGSTTITVYLGGNQIDSYTLAAGAATRKNYANNNGPLRVVSSSQPIMSTVRTVYGSSSYYEMTGLPSSWLSAKYWFPWYNNVAMDTQLRIAVP